MKIEKKNDGALQERRVDRAVSQLVVASPFWGTLLLCLKRQFMSTPYERGGDGFTMGTDGVRLTINRNFVATLNDAELRGVLAHEISHVARDHMGRLGNRDQALANVAADYAINPDLLDDGFVLPQNALVERRYKGWSFEQIYADLARGQRQKKDAENCFGKEKDERSGDQSQQPQQQPKKDEPQPEHGDPDLQEQPGESGDDGQQQQEQGGGDPQGEEEEPAPDQQGQGQGEQQAKPPECPDPGGCGGVMPAPSPEVSQEWESRVVTLAKAMARGEGRLPAGVQALVGDLGKPRVSWREAMRRFVTQSTQRDYAWTRPNRRHVADGIYLPSLVSNGRGRVVVAVDISGSIDKDALAAFRGELQQMLDEQAADAVTVIYCDTDVKHDKTDEYECGDIVGMTPYAGGGTRFSPAIKWAVDNVDDAACLVYFTDLDCSDHGREPALPVLWAAYGSLAKHAHWQPPFGEVVHIDAYDR